MSETSSLGAACDAVLRERDEPDDDSVVGGDGLPAVKVDVVLHPIQPPNPGDLNLGEE